MNANVLHRWLKERVSVVREERPTFIPVAMPVAAQQPTMQDFKVEMRNGALVAELRPVSLKLLR